MPESSSQPRVGVVGPLPPPSGGMANQCEQLTRLLAADGTAVLLACTNPPYRPKVIGRIPLLRAGLRLLPYLSRLWQITGKVDVLHVFANSGWAWHLFVLPALLIARIRGVGAIVNYRGGNADTFFASAPAHVRRMLAGASLRVTPSAYLLRVFKKHGLSAEVIPNIVDLTRFRPAEFRDPLELPHLVVTRNLENIYDIPTAILAFQRVRQSFPKARMTVAGSGPERQNLQLLVSKLGLGASIVFAGRIDNAEMASLYASADCMLNPSSVDNMPISILEAFASGVPVVSTDAGGIPDLIENGVSGLLVPVGDDRAMADRVIELLRERNKARALRDAGLSEAQRYSWHRVRDLWLDAYRRAAAARSV